MAMSLGSNSHRAEINVTPMIDVLLVLIIIFMVITPTPSNGLQALLPLAAPDRPGAIAPSNDIVVTVTGDHTIRINQEAVAMADLHDRLLALFRNHTNHLVFVRGEKGLQFGEVAQVIDVAHGVGLDRVALMTN